MRSAWEGEESGDRQRQRREDGKPRMAQRQRERAVEDPAEPGQDQPSRHQRCGRPPAAGSSQPASAGVSVSASASEATSMMMTDLAIEPTKSPTGPGRSAIGMKASTVVSVEASSGTARVRTERRIASSRGVPSARRLRISSVITMAASTSRPRATIIPVTDIWWIEMPATSIPKSEISAASGMAVATTRAARHPRVTKSTSVTRPMPAARFAPGRRTAP